MEQFLLPSDPRAIVSGKKEGRLALIFRGACGGALGSGLRRAMPLPDTMFCAQQIHIPPELPDILKQFTKAAIRTQPADVLQWSAGYFSALSRGDPLPVKDRIEMPMATQKTDTGLTQGLLKVLHKQCSHKEYVDLADLEQKWKNLCLPIEKFKALLQLDPCEDKIEWIKFLALGCSMLGGSLNTAMKHLCEILTTDPEGGPARIPFGTFSYVYRYLSELDSDISASDTEAYLSSLKEGRPLSIARWLQWEALPKGSFPWAHKRWFLFMVKYVSEPLTCVPITFKYEPSRQFLCSH
ncbi:hypothetical protein K5549_006685 [Capra hircus]|nr:hypothetical protein K5549_006685 [Capra hircus]